MSPAFRALVLPALLVTAAFSPADDTPPKIKDGISGKIKSVDIQGKTLTMTTAAGKEQTFTISNETILLGPLGGRVTRNLRDPRFRQGFPITVVADGKAAVKIVFGFAQYAEKDKAGNGNALEAELSASSVKPDAAKTTIAAAKAKEAIKEISGKIKSFDPERQVLVMTLSSGKDRPYLLTKDLAVLVDGKASKEGAKNLALKVGAAIKVSLDDEEAIRVIRVFTPGSVGTK
jgi:hypothetical protein